MKISLLYGRGELEVRLPEGCEPTVIEKPSMPVFDDPAAAVASALDGGKLVDAAAGARSACILICDITRPVPNRLFLRPLIERLEDAGIPCAAITVLVATGLHRPNLGDELAELVGDPWVLERVRVVNHYARNDEVHVDLGRTRSGTPIRLDRRFVEADVRIATGLVEPHFMAGYSGGRKVIAPASPTPRPSPRFTTIASCPTRARTTACWTAIPFTGNRWRFWSASGAPSRSTR